MTKPANMTPEQDAAWRKRRSEREDTPEFKAKQQVRNKRFYCKPGSKEKITAKTRAYRATAEGKAHRNTLQRIALAKSEKEQEKNLKRKHEWRLTEFGKEKNREHSRRVYQKKRLNEEFDAFLVRLESEEVQA